MRFFIAFLIAFIGASWVYNDARNRGISAFPWAFLTFLAVIIGLPLYLFLRPKGDISECIYCNKRKLTSLSVCPHCRNIDQMHPEEIIDEAPSKQSNKKVCIVCNKILDSDWKYCPYCGSKQTETLH